MAQHSTVPDQAHQRPAHLDDTTVEALGSVSKAFEVVERVRGHLYALHQLMGSADFELDNAITLLRKSGHPDWADTIQTQLIGRNIIEGRWTFQLVEEFDDGYYSAFQQLEKAIRDELADGKRHLYEAELKEHRRTTGLAGHESRP